MESADILDNFENWKTGVLKEAQCKYYPSDNVKSEDLSEKEGKFSKNGRYLKKVWTYLECKDIFAKCEHLKGHRWKVRTIVIVLYSKWHSMNTNLLNIANVVKTFLYKLKLITKSVFTGFD